MVTLTITLTIVVFGMVDWRFYALFKKLGLDFGTEGDIIIILLIFTSIITCGVTFGFLYDRIFQLWKTSTVVAVERNPYTKQMMQPKEVLNWHYFFIPMLRSTGKDDEADLMEKWNNKCLKENPELRAEVNDVLKWIDDYDLSDPKNIFLDTDIKKAVKKARKG